MPTDADTNIFVGRVISVERTIMSKHTNQPNGTPLSRRRLVRAGAVGSIAGLAGCGGQDSETPTGGTPGGGTDGTTTDGSNTEAEPKEAVFDIPLERLPTDANFNMAGKQAALAMRWLVFATPWTRTLGGDVIWDLVEENGYKYDSDELSRTISYKEGFTWWNGDPVTAQSAYYDAEFGRLQNPEASNFERHELLDDYTLKSWYKEAQNPNMIMFVRPVTDLITPFFKSFFERMEDATTQDEKDQVLTDLNETQVDIEEFVEKGWGNAMFEITDWSSQGMELTKRADHPYADQTDLEKIKAKVAAEETVTNQYITNDKLDAGDSTLPPAVQGNAPDNIENVTEFGGVGMLQLQLNHFNKHLRKRDFRRALANLIDMSHVQSNNQSGRVLEDNNWGMVPAMARNYLGDKVDDFIDYPHKSDTQAATNLLEGMGYSRNSSGTWVDPDGNVVEFDMPAVNWGDEYTLTAKTVSEQMKGFGLKVNFISVNTDQLVEDVYRNQKYDLVCLTHYGGYRFHPYDYFNLQSWFGNVFQWPDGWSKVKQWMDEGLERSQYNGKPFYVDVPKEFGAKEIQGSGRTLNVPELEKELETVSDDAREKEIVQDLAQYWNYSLPGIEVFQFTSGFWGDTGNFEFPDESGYLRTYRPSSFLPNIGEVNHKY